MKKVLIILLAIANFSELVAQTPKKWSEWRTVLNVGCGPQISYRYQQSTCGKYGINGSPIVELKHSDGLVDASLEIRLKGVDCNGNYSTGSYSTSNNYIKAWQAYSYSGNWHTFEKIEDVVSTKVKVKLDNGDIMEYRGEMTSLGLKCRIFINGRPEGEVLQERIEREEAKQAELKRKEQEKISQQKAAEEQRRNEEAEFKRKDQEKKKAELLANQKKDDEKSASQKDNNSDRDDSKSKSGNSTYVESEESRRLRERREAQEKLNNSENQVASAIFGTIAGVAGALNDRSDQSDYQDREYSVILRGELGACIPVIPVTANDFGLANSTSTSSTTAPMSAMVGLEAKFLSNMFIGFTLNPYFIYGNYALYSSTGDAMAYGGNASMKFGRVLQLLLKGSYEARKGYERSDLMEYGLDGYTTSKFNYNTLKYGAGIAIDFVELYVLKESISFLRDKKTEIYSYELKAAYDLFGMIFKYSANYPVAGEVIYPGLHDMKKKNYFHIGMYFRFAIAPSD